MRAMRAEAFGGYQDLKLTDIPSPALSDGRVSVRMTAAGVTPLDHTILSGQYPKAKAPLVLGNEGAGIVEGGGTVEYPTGSRVMFTGPYGVLENGTLSQWLCQLSRLLIDDVSAILPRAQAVSRMPSAIAALRMCCQRRVAAGTRWRMRDRQRRKFRSSSWPQQYRLADPVLFNPSIGRHRLLMPR